MTCFKEVCRGGAVKIRCFLELNQHGLKSNTDAGDFFSGIKSAESGKYTKDIRKSFF